MHALSRSLFIYPSPSFPSPPSTLTWCNNLYKSIRVLVDRRLRDAGGSCPRGTVTRQRRLCHFFNVSQWPYFCVQHCMRLNRVVGGGVKCSFNLLKLQHINKKTKQYSVETELYSLYVHGYLLRSTLCISRLCLHLRGKLKKLRYFRRLSAEQTI